MTPKEKASHLVETFKGIIVDDNDYNTYIKNEAAKQCSLITVRELLGGLAQHHEIDFWEEVRTEIEKM